MTKGTFIFDVDGTLADNTHRLCHINKAPPDWETYHSLDYLDQPIPDVIGIAQELHEAGYTVLNVSGRGEERRQPTEQWLLEALGFSTTLFMRPTGNHKPDDYIKLQLYRKHIEGKYNVLGIFDDRDRVVAMWRRLGLRCYQVRPGDF